MANGTIYNRNDLLDLFCNVAFQQNIQLTPDEFMSVKNAITSDETADEMTHDDIWRKCSNLIFSVVDGLL